MFKIGENATHLDLAKTIASKMQKDYAYNARDIQKFFVDKSGFPIYSEQKIHIIMRTACYNDLFHKNNVLFMDVGNYLSKQHKSLDGLNSRVHYMLAIKDEKKDSDEEDDNFKIIDEDDGYYR